MTSPALIDGPRVGPASGEAAKSLVILLHGYGSNGADLIGLVPYWRALLPHAAWASPNAPQACPGAPGGYQWWGLSGLDRDSRSAGVAQAAPAANAFIDAELARHGLTNDRLALVGFSQGTMMALHVGLRRSPAIAGIVGFSGMLADEAPPQGGPATPPPVLLIHGDADPMIPVAAFHRAKAALEGQGVRLATHVSPGLAHSIDAAGLQLAGGFLAALLA